MKTMKKTELQKAIATLLFQNSDGFTNAEIARELGVEPTATFAQLKVMLETNTIEKIDKTYLISDFGIAAYGVKHLAPATKPPAKSPSAQIEKPPVKTVEPAPPVTESALVQNLNAAAREIVRRFNDPKMPTTLGDDGECEVVQAAKSNTAEKIDQPVDDLKICRAFQEKHMKKPVVWDSRISNEPHINPNQESALHDFESKLHDDCVASKPYSHHIPINDMTEQQIKQFKNTLALAQQDAGAHYRYQYKGINLDPFRIAQIYGVTDFALQTALKKILCAGNRGHKDLRQDLLDVQCAIARKLEMLVEDEAVGVA